MFSVTCGGSKCKRAGHDNVSMTSHLPRLYRTHSIIIYNHVHMKVGTGRDTVSHSLVSQTSDCEAVKGEKLSTRVTVVRVLEVQRVQTQDSVENEK